MNNINIFRYYSQPENRFTNNLISVLRIMYHTDRNFINDFDQKFFNIKFTKNINFKVLRDINGTADAELSDENNVILIETKISSGTIRKDQIKSHLKNLSKYKQKNKRLILITPDTPDSSYISKFVKIDPKRIIHIQWKSIINYLSHYETSNGICNLIIKDLYNEIKEIIFEQDIAAVIVKIKFGDKSGVYEDDYIKEFRNGEWDGWNTPTKYHELDDKGRKLVLYHKNIGLVLEVEIERVRKIPNRRAYPWSNKFVKNSLKIHKNPIPLNTILKIPPTIQDKYKSEKDGKKHGFCNFKNNQTPNWNLTREQYEWLSCRMENEK